MRSFVILALCTLAACSDAGAKEEEKYQIVVRESQGKFQPYVARCAQAKAVAAAYLSDSNEPKYQEWKSTADLDCGLTDVKY
ncbi:hypothetical protein ACFOKF_15535 [Sphingobium rhizovicinum]|uniref:Lipoprotein n=1 Tax=Sphingobium rhizovicinum TaxID=432308 RepID=A0ABV7NJE2_9SPHN